MSERHRKGGCPGTRELELYCIGEVAAVRTKEFIEAHSKICPRCAKKVHNLRAFYAIFAKELDQPAHPGVIDFCKKRAYTSVKYGLLVCRPIPEKDRQHGKAYLATLAFSANGDGSRRCLADFEINDDQIGVMLYSDPLRHELLLFLWSREDARLTPRRLYAPGLFEQAEFNAAGAAKIPLTSFEFLNNRLIYFSMQSRAGKQHNILTRVQEMVS